MVVKQIHVNAGLDLHFWVGKTIFTLQVAFENLGIVENFGWGTMAKIETTEAMACM